MVNPTCSIKKDVRGFRLIRFFLNEILQMSKFKFFVSQVKFSGIAQIFLIFANAEHNYFEKLFWKIVERLVRLLVGEVEKLTCPWHIGRPSCIIGTPLARSRVYWNVVALWHMGTETTLARMALNLANSHTLCESVNVTMKTTINFYVALCYLVIKEKFE